MFKGLWGRLGVALVAATLLAGCSATKPDPDVDAAARSVYVQVRDADPALVARLTPDLQNPQTMAELAKVRTYIPAGEPKSVRPMFWTKSIMTGQPQTAFVRHLYDYGDRRVLAETTLRLDAGKRLWLVQGLHVQNATLREIAVNDFTLIGKSPGQYGFLAATVLSPLLMIVALVTVIRRRNLKWKPLWCILAFFGLFSFGMNWTSGDVMAQWLTVQLIGAGITSSGTGFDPWLLKVTFPLGALLILSGVWARPRKPKPEPEVS